jgi:hypothetical protein
MGYLHRIALYALYAQMWAPKAQNTDLSCHAFTAFKIAFKSSNASQNLTLVLDSSYVKNLISASPDNAVCFNL